MDECEASLVARLTATERGRLAAMVSKWGGDPNAFCKPAPYLLTLRQGVDRPAGWTPPSI